MITKLRVFIIDHCEIMFVMFIEKKNFASKKLWGHLQNSWDGNNVRCFCERFSGEHNTIAREHKRIEISFAPQSLIFLSITMPIVHLGFL